jgi:hypothetical protein
VSKAVGEVVFNTRSLVAEFRTCRNDDIQSQLHPPINLPFRSLSLSKCLNNSDEKIPIVMKITFEAK